MEIYLLMLLKKAMFINVATVELLKLRLIILPTASGVIVLNAVCTLIIEGQL